MSPILSTPSGAASYGKRPPAAIELTSEGVIAASLPGKHEDPVFAFEPLRPGILVPGISELSKIVGASMTVGLVLAVLALIISAIVWALGANSSNPHLAGRGKLGVLVALGAAIVCGASVTLVNFFWNVGQSVD